MGRITTRSVHKILTVASGKPNAKVVRGRKEKLRPLEVMSKRIHKKTQEAFNEETTGC